MVFGQALGLLCLLHFLLSWGEGWWGENTITRCGICCWDGAGSSPGGEQSPVEQAGVGMVCGFPAECSGMSCPATLVLSCTASSKVDSAGEESGTQLQVELVRNLSESGEAGAAVGPSDHEHGTRLSHVDGGAVVGRPTGSGSAPGTPEHPLTVPPAS